MEAQLSSLGAWSVWGMGCATSRLEKYPGQEISMASRCSSLCQRASRLDVVELLQARVGGLRESALQLGLEGGQAPVADRAQWIDEESGPDAGGRHRQ